MTLKVYELTFGATLTTNLLFDEAGSYPVNWRGPIANSESFLCPKNTILRLYTFDPAFGGYTIVNSSPATGMALGDI